MLRRRSTRKFVGDAAVARGALEQIVACAQAAPTGRNQQPLRFYVVATPALVHTIGEQTEALALPRFPHLQERKAALGLHNAVTYQATALLCIVHDAALASQPGGTVAADVGFAAMSALLAAEALGLGAVPVALAGTANGPGILRTIGADPDKDKLALIIPIGVPDPDYAQKHRPKKDITSPVVWL
jgi:nitroreductase